ncbi:sterol desaturase family protein [Nocardioides ganghwensis]|uniref:Sterol desaturase family protein n=1 Tax=Nocardioides ganghwensis TaxID=252230 RepID=A0A4Q2SBR3_9ACTN|nr:sterol desaturase family protein [Nocardioides ganghwensis]MBD3947603.1 sterol desaturase family protein [Nocardioides ganghwensis]RYB99381.1 sterol desaturase family protein [Nocardioides ganghwensis]
MKVDLTVAAIPAFVGAMAAEYAWQRAHPVEPGTRAGDYQLADTVASLSMGVGSLAAPYVARRLLDPVTPGVGRHGRTLLAVGAATAALTTVGDVVRRRLRDGRLPDPQTVPAQVREVQEELADILQGPAVRPEDRTVDRTVDRIPPALRRAHGALAVSAVASTALVTSTTWAAMTSGKRLFARSPLDLGGGRWALLAAALGWDFVYYWNHRLSHESRWLWAVHVVHHSSERYNLSTALRQPVAEGVTLTVPYGLLALAGVRPALIEQARGINLIYQFWIHTEAIQRLGWVEKVFNTPSHHRVHHGSNRDYLDRNHGSILILWDRLFGTFEEEDEPVVYGLTANIDSYDPARIATHEWTDIAADVAAADTWHDRWSFLLRRPGWAYARRAAAGVA